MSVYNAGIPENGSRPGLPSRISGVEEQSWQNRITVRSRRYSEIAPVPGSPDYVLGIINLRGNVVTVIDTRMRFGIEPMEVTDSSRIVIIEAGGQVVGILVDSVAEVVDLSADDIDPAPNIGTEESAQFIKGVANLGEELLIIIDLNKLLTSEEWDEISRI